MLNLLVNAWQAMSRQGDMTLASEAVTLSEAFASHTSGGRAAMSTSA